MGVPAKTDVEREVAWLRSQMGFMVEAPPRSSSGGDWVFSNSPSMKDIEKMIDRVAATDLTVLVWGESGVGKEVLARTLHHRSPRRQRQFVKVNCAALPLELLESELFGYERGAFTGAHRHKPGKFELADSGTICLDEIGEIPLPLQAKLLHVLQDGEFSRLGGREDVRVDARVIACTNKDLGQAVARGAFREDLYHRLNVLSILVPPLRKRREEIPILVEYFLGQYARQYGRPRWAVSSETMRRFMDYTWPGNIRELDNVVKRIVVLGNEEWVAPDLMGRQRQAASPAVGAPSPSLHDLPPESRDNGLGLKEIARRAAREAERAALKEVLDQVHWNRVQAARRLKISYKALLYKIEQCGLRD